MDDISEVFFVGFSLLFATYFSNVGFRIIYQRVILLGVYASKYFTIQFMGQKCLKWAI